MKPSKRLRRSSADTPVSGFRERTAFGRAFRKRIQGFIHENKLLPKGSRVLLAVSGGPDSTALFHIFLSLRETFGLKLAAAHVNYRLRGEDSEKDEASVRLLCSRHDIPLAVLRPKNAAGKNEEALRDIRYRFFERTRERLGFQLVAVAHNRDDQAETVLLRLLRGAGAEGLSAIRAKRGVIIRPFLETPREDILRYLKEERVPFRIDRSNRDTRILRNRIRLKLLPLLEREYQPNIRNVLARTARVLGKDSGDRSACGLPLKTAVVSFSRREFLALSDTEQASIVRTFSKIVSAVGKNPGESFVREVRKTLRSTKGKIQIVHFGQLKLEARGDRVTLISQKS